MLQPVQEGNTSLRRVHVVPIEYVVDVAPGRTVPGAYNTHVKLGIIVQVARPEHNVTLVTRVQRVLVVRQSAAWQLHLLLHTAAIHSIRGIYLPTPVSNVHIDSVTLDTTVHPL